MSWIDLDVTEPRFHPFQPSPDPEVSWLDPFETSDSSPAAWDLLDRYTQAVEHLPAVRLVLLEGTDFEEEGRIWTVITAPPFDAEYRKPVYEAQRDILEGFDRPLISFRLINTEELHTELAEVLPSDYVLLFEREVRP